MIKLEDEIIYLPRILLNFYCIFAIGIIFILMTESDKFSRLFSSMTPVTTLGHTTRNKAAHFLFFKINIIEGEPFLETSASAKDMSRMNPADMSIYRELTRISESGDIFGIKTSISGKKTASFWENPYLVHLIENQHSIKSPDGSAVVFSESSATLILEIESSKDSDEVSVALRLNVGDDVLDGIIFLDDSHVLCSDTVYEVKSVGINYPKIHSLISSVSKNFLEVYLTLFLTYFENVIPVYDGTPARKSSNSEHSVPTLYLEKVAPDKALYLRTGISLESLGNSLPGEVMPVRAASLDGKNRIVIRDVENCNTEELTMRLESMILSCAPDRNAKKEIYRDGNFFIIPESTAAPFILNHLPELLEDFKLVGSEKLKEYKITPVEPKLNMKFSSGIDFLEGEGDIEIGNEHFSISDILSRFSKKRYIELSDGNKGIVDENYIKRLQRLFRRRDKDGRIRVNLFDLPEVEELLQNKIKGEFANKSRAVLSGFNRIGKNPCPDYVVNAQMRPYQIDGVKWLKYLYDNRLGGCLADDMGLGKTLQTLALLSMIYPQCTSPTLIVMPRSLLFNWEKELDRFAPSISHSTYYGPDRDLEKALESNVVLTTYALARNDIMKLKDIRFQCIVLDESQNIKNLSSQTALAVRMLVSDHRFALSGTPMENNLTELYSLFCFLNPTMFGSAEDFNSSYTYPIQKFGDKDASESLRRKIFPFILRRLKKDVLDDLPERIDQTIYVEMSEKQHRLYNERRLSYRRQINEIISRDGVEKSQFLMFQALNELRRIASVPESMSDGIVASPKIDELMDSLISSVSNGHKSVVFFNFIAGLEIVMSRLEKIGIEFETMTGSTSASARKRIVEHFQSDPECKVMLLTLKVGGVGLNLTAADTVYIFEPWWNKAAEEQAINRLHRIGQKSTVNAFSLITVGTIEEKILQLQEQKKELFNELISADTASSKHLSEKDIDFILS